LLGFQLLFHYKAAIVGTGYKSLGYQNSISFRQNLSNKYLILNTPNQKISLLKKTALLYSSRSIMFNNIIFSGLKKNVVSNLYKKKGLLLQKQNVILKQGKISKT
jgi:hypothetical protein